MKINEMLTESQLDELKCWTGYKRVPGVPAGAPGSCRKSTSEDTEQLEELSPQTLARYKKAAGASAREADRAGDFAKGNKRFSGIVRATKKEFDQATKKKPEQGVAEGSGYNIDQDDHNEFTPDEIERIKQAHFPDTLRSNLRAKKAETAKRERFNKLKGSDAGGDSKLITPIGSSDNTYEGVAEDTNELGYHTRVRRGDFRPSKYGEDEYNYLHDLMNTSGDGSGPMLVTINDKKIARQIAAMYGGDVEETGLGTYRIVQRRGNSPMGNEMPKLTGVAEGKYDPAKDTFNPETHAAITKDGVDKLIPKSQLAKYKEQGWKERHSLKAFHKNREKQGVTEGSLNEGQYEMMLRNGQVKKFVAKDDADAKRIAAGHGAKSVIKLKGGVPAGKVVENLDPDTQRLEIDIRNALENGDDYTAKQYAKMAPTPEAKKYLLNIIKQEMYGTEPGQGGVAEGTGDTKTQVVDKYKGWRFEIETQAEDDRYVKYYGAVSPEGKWHNLPKRATAEQFRQLVDSKGVTEGVPSKYLSGTDKVDNISPVLTKPYGSARQTKLMKKSFGSS
jgi:hypothetical protein